MKVLVAVAFLGYVAAGSLGRCPGPDIVPIPGGLSGDGVTTTYWDCCAQTCAHRQNVKTDNGIPVQTCAIDGATNITIDQNGIVSGCRVGGQAFACSNQQPYVVSDTLALGWSAASFTGGIDNSKCCSCFLLSFKDQLAGKQMLVQLVNSGTDLASNHFDLQIPGGGVGIWNHGCDAQWGAGENGWGRRYDGVSSLEECCLLPEVLQPGCRFRFQFMEGVYRPNVTFQEVQCPAELIAVTACGNLNY
uniref:cellulase n=1 Tax=Diabrotica virgifera virgifera TaxID=50390 RepID=A0A6P7GEB1_DIAVI